MSNVVPNSEIDENEKDALECSSTTKALNGDESEIPPASLILTLNSEDMYIGDCLQVIDALHYNCGFPIEIAKSAVELLGPDFSSAYNYILDNYPIHDNGGSVLPITDCPHVGHHIVIPPQTLNTSLFHTFCSYIPKEKNLDDGIGRAKEDIDGNCCPSKDENWICLHCGVVLCSRYQYGHGIRHWEESQQSDPGIDQAGHCISASLTDLSVWCHSCKAYLDGTIVREYIIRLEELKFGS
jgi:Zn-finger in ubiquitin-hydrolases and other protein